MSSDGNDSCLMEMKKENVLIRSAVRNGVKALISSSSSFRRRAQFFFSFSRRRRRNDEEEKRTFASIYFQILSPYRLLTSKTINRYLKLFNQLLTHRITTKNIRLILN